MVLLSAVAESFAANVQTLSSGAYYSDSNMCVFFVFYLDDVIW